VAQTLPAPGDEGSPEAPVIQIDPDGTPAQAPPDTPEARGPLHVEKLEGRQESGRDAQDEDEEDEEPD